jgi:signal transduction histidine kinase
MATGIAGWLMALVLALAVVRLRRRLELVAEAGHELRGPVGALSYAVAWLRREPGGVRRALRFEAELERMRAGLADLDAARAGRRAPPRPQTMALERLVNGAAAGWRAAVTGAGRGVTVRWEAGRAQVRADRSRLSQALGNLLANAAEHGSGPIEVRALRHGPRAVRVEIRDSGPAARPGRHRARPADRGRGLRIAERAIREAGGSLELERNRSGTAAVVELPLAAGAGVDPAGADRWSERRAQSRFERSVAPRASRIAATSEAASRVAATSEAASRVAATSEASS